MLRNVAMEAAVGHYSNSHHHHHHHHHHHVCVVGCDWSDLVGKEGS